MKKEANKSEKKVKKPSKYDEVFVIKGNFEDVVKQVVSTPVEKVKKEKP